jgi:hypothetical protein
MLIEQLESENIEMSSTNTYADHFHFEPSDFTAKNESLVLHSLPTDTNTTAFTASDYCRVEIATEEAF